jgi:calcyclin binding protein
MKRKLLKSKIHIFINNLIEIYYNRPLPKMDEGKDPGDSLMQMMKNMYETGDDEMKRTIAKAWTESREKMNTGGGGPGGDLGMPGF